MGIPILFDEILLNSRISEYIEWLPQEAPHCAIFGATGTGKTYFSKLLLGKVVLHEPNSQIFVLNFKGDEDFSFLDGCDRYFQFDKCRKGLQEFYQLFQARQSGEDKGRNMLVMFFDEWASYCNSISDDKKILEAEKRKLSNLLMLGRSFRIHVILSQQRLDASYFNATRDNFSLVVGLGNLSQEAKDMMFSEFKKEMLPNRRRGTGYMIINGANFRAVVVPQISDWDKLHITIKNGVTR